MKKVIIAAAITTLFSTMATANSGLADRINEARSYPDKTGISKSMEMPCMQDKQAQIDMSESQAIRGELKSQ
ncbi:hypothetical protein [Marinobacter sp.]|uniref:hypothetical protein n=1 Tax=Marinobacter sp. TaxID=50741 RepID=UPI0035C6EE57